MKSEILLEFYGENPELCKVLFRRDNGEVTVSIRGKTAGAIQGAGSFQWSSAVKALSSICIRTALSALDKTNSSIATISGFGGSLASTLDYALSKQPTWTTDMFGVDACGQSYLRRLLLRTNPERKYPGPVVVRINSKILPGEQITIWWNGAKVSSSEQLHVLLSSIEETHNTSSVMSKVTELKTLKGGKLAA